MRKPLSRTRGWSLVAAVVAAAAIAVPLGIGSSHREAPNIMLDPAADNTDVYAWTAPGAEDAITIASNWIPGQVPANGPNFFRFDDRARYYNNIDNNGDGVADIRYRFTFDTEVRNPNSFLYAGPGTQSFADPGLNVIQRYDLVREEYKQRQAEVEAEDRQQPPGRAAEHRAEDVPELRQLRRRGDADARRRDEAVRRHPRRSVLRRPRGHVRRDQRPRAAPATRAQGRDDLSGYWTSTDGHADPRGRRHPQRPGRSLGRREQRRRRRLVDHRAPQARGHQRQLRRQGSHEKVNKQDEQVGPGLATRQPADQRGRDPARQEGQVQPHDSRTATPSCTASTRPPRSSRRC